MLQFSLINQMFIDFLTFFIIFQRKLSVFYYFDSKQLEEFWIKTVNGTIASTERFWNGLQTWLTCNCCFNFPAQILFSWIFVVGLHGFDSPFFSLSKIIIIWRDFCLYGSSNFGGFSFHDQSLKIHADIVSVRPPSFFERILRKNGRTFKLMSGNEWILEIFPKDFIWQEFNRC